MHNPGFLEHWRPTLSRGDVLAHAASEKSSAFTRAAVALGLSFAPVFAVATVCAAFLLIDSFF
jgi:hypothetical protein